MPQRSLSLVSALAFVTTAAVILAGCADGGTARTTGNGGTTGTGGTSATGGSTGNPGTGGDTSTGSGGDTSSGTGGTTGTPSGGTTGSTGGTTGIPSGGTTGSTGGTTGSTGGTTGATGGTPGTGGTPATGGSNGGPTGPSAGCNMPPPASESSGKVATHMMMISSVATKYPTYVNRKYYTTLPTAYDPAKPYPVVFWGPGCGATGPEGSNFTSGHFLTDILYVQLLSVTGCFQANKQGTIDSPDGPYFDEVVSEVEAHYCVDKARLYAAGTSSGAWLSNYYACVRGNVIRAASADSGGLQHDHIPCTGGAAVLEMPGDSTSAVVNGFDIGVGPARDLFIAKNGCSTTPSTMTFGKANNCQVYGGCASPVVWCNVGGAHQSGNNLIAEASWAFWATLK